jgi:hypothetical protein
MPGSELSTNDFSVNGLRTWYYSSSFANATTMPLAILSPNATTSLELFGFQINTATGTAATIEIATSTSAFATSSAPLRTITVAANEKVTAEWRPAGNGVHDNIVSPKTWLVLKTNEPGLAGYTWGAKAKIILREF